MKYKTKNLLKKVITGVLAVGVVAGATAGVVSLARHAKEDLREINPTFKVGGLNEQGKYVEREDTLYTKEAFECRGLEISLSFENDINYQVFYYNETGDFVESTEVLDTNYTLDKCDLINCTYARVMIIPQWSNLEATEDKTIEEQKVINWRNKGSFVDQMTIKVLKDQDYEYEHFEESLSLLKNSSYGLEDHYLVEKEGYNYLMFVVTEFKDRVSSFEIHFDNKFINDENSAIHYGGVQYNLKNDIKNNILVIGAQYIRMEDCTIHITYPSNGAIPQIKVNL